MAVYVDDMQPCRPNARWRYRQACHLVADDLEELHAAAQAIGLRHEWFQNHPRLPHYDLVASKRALAVKHGAREVDRKTIVSMTTRISK